MHPFVKELLKLVATTFVTAGVTVVVNKAVERHIERKKAAKEKQDQCAE